VAAQDSDSGLNAPEPTSNGGPEPQAVKAEEISHRWRARFKKTITSNWFVGIVSGLISGALVTFSITATGHSAGVRMLQMAHWANAPSCTNPGWLLQVPDDQILANSWYAALDTLPHYETLHTPDLTVDGNVRTAWLQWWPTEGLSRSASSGNYITWAFAQPYDVRLACVLNGWEEDSRTFNSAEPVKYVTMGDTAPGCKGTWAKLKIHSYTYAWNPVQLSRSHSTRFLCLQIRYPYLVNKKQLDCAPGPNGHTRPCRVLTGLSEIRFYYSPAPLSWMPY
jgi:hypothetical protein